MSSAAARDLCIFHGSDSLLAGAFSTSGQVAVTGGKGRTVSLWDTDGGDKIMSMPAHMTDVTAVAFKGDNSAVGSGDANGLLKIWDLREARLQRNLDGHRLKINAIGFYPDDEASICATGSQEGRTKLWDVRRKGFFRTFGKKGSAPVYSCQFSPDGQLCAIGDEDGLKIWKITDETEPIFSCSLRKCKKLAFHHREMLLAATSFENSLAQVHFIDLEKLSKENSVKIGPNEVDSITFNRDQPALLVASQGKMDVVGWEPNDVFDSVVVDWKKSLASAESNSSLLVMSECDRSVGKISSVDLSKIQLTRPETPMTASRRHFEGSRPGTMEAFLGNNNEIKHVEDEIANIEISNPNKFAALFNKNPGMERAKSDLTHLKHASVPKQNFNNVISSKSQPQVDYSGSPMSRQRSMEPVNRVPQQNSFAAPYKSPARAPPASISQSVALSQNNAKPASRNDYRTAISHSGFGSNPSKPSGSIIQNLLDDGIDFKLENRRNTLESIAQFWPDFDSVITSAYGHGDEGAIVDILKLINRNISVWSLGMVATILDPKQTISVGRMILSPNLSVCDTILDSLKLILKYFDQTILDNLQPATHTNIDLQSEERRQRARICYESLCQSKSMLQAKVRENSTPDVAGKIRQILNSMAHF